LKLYLILPPFPIVPGSPIAKERLDMMINELRSVQVALGQGYLSAFPSELFDRVEALSPVWAPYYTVGNLFYILAAA
jgi:hypothetical protein